MRKACDLWDQKLATKEMFMGGYATVTISLPLTYHYWIIVEVIIKLDVEKDISQA